MKNRSEKVSALEAENLEKEKQNLQIKNISIQNSEVSAKKLFKVYKIVAKLSIVIIVLFIAFLGYFLKNETDSTLSVAAYIFSGISILISLISWSKFSVKLKNKAYRNHEILLKQYD